MKETLKVWMMIVVLPMLWFCVALGISLGTDNPMYLVWLIIVPMLLALAYALGPRAGRHYAYWNRYMAMFGGLMLGLIAVPILGGYLIVKFHLSSDVWAVTTLGWWSVFIPGFFLWFKFLFMPAWGPRHLRKTYPEMVAAASRLKKFGESYGWYFPLIHAHDKPYLVVAYTNRYVSGMATLDERGCFIKDELLAIRLLRCYKLATAVLDMPVSHARAKQIDLYKGIDRQMQKAYRRFRENEKNFLAAGQPAHDRWKAICDFEPDHQAILGNEIERRTWLAEWAFEHGLNKLTEISDKQLRQVEDKMEQFNTDRLSHTAQLERVGEYAATLLKYVQGKAIRLERRGAVEELLKALIELRQRAAAWKPDPTDFYVEPMEWDAWKERRARAVKFERDGEL